jgi:hypothetical protein
MRQTRVTLGEKETTMSLGMGKSVSCIAEHLAVLYVLVSEPDWKHKPYFFEQLLSKGRYVAEEILKTDTFGTDDTDEPVIGWRETFFGERNTDYSPVGAFGYGDVRRVENRIIATALKDREENLADQEQMLKNVAYDESGVRIEPLDRIEHKQQLEAKYRAIADAKINIQQ